MTTTRTKTKTPAPEVTSRDFERVSWRVDALNERLTKVEKLEKRIEALESLNNEMGLAILSLNGSRDRIERHVQAHKIDIDQAYIKLSIYLDRLRKLDRKIKKLNRGQNVE